ncbi:type VII secretion protein EccCa [Kribbella sp. NPDC056345]|uniref:type VII secretion protein EccCa n=1 Tax=Kribbella sp. NPDC056345 TaxID=3345789 RepID=UPI0035E1EB21
MSTMVVRRPDRRPGPDLPGGELLLSAPPEVPEPGGRQWAQALMVLPMIAMMGAMMLMFSGSMSGGLRYAVYGLFGVAFVGMIVGGLMMRSGGGGKAEMGHARRTYLRGLAQHRTRLTRSVDSQREALQYVHPEPDSLWALAASHRLWERRRDDEDFGVTRIGVGPQAPAIGIVPPDTQPLERLEPLSALALRRFVSTYVTIPELPVAVAITGFARIHLTGDRERTNGLVRAMLAQLATLHAPDNLRIAVVTDVDQESEWDWVKWMPHALHPERTDALGAARLIGPSITAVEAMLDDLLTGRPRFDSDGGYSPAGVHIVVVLAGGDVTGSDHLLADRGLDGVTVLDLVSRPPRSLDASAIVLDVASDRALHAETIDGDSLLGRADELSVGAAEGLARQLAPLRLTAGVHSDQPLTADLGLGELLELGDPYEFDPTETWVQRPSRDRLRVRYGLRADGLPIELDLKESAQEGMGPHGLLIGATGSGKSELLRTLVLALAITHPPRSLNFALIDYKGGATFATLDKLPHTSAVITNLADELDLVDRMTDAINGELIRRQELLRDAGNFASLRDYEKARLAGAPLPEVPTLLVVCDEFSELLSDRPDFIDLFVQIGRVGRSLGVHLLLASQRLDEGRLRGLDAHLSFRIGLRTFSDMDSRTVLGVNDAFLLPRAPGHGFLKVGTEQMDRFRSAYVSGVHRRPTADQLPVSPDNSLVLQEYVSGYVSPPAELEAPEPHRTDDAFDPSVGETLLDILVGRMADRGDPAHQIWLPPLGASPCLDEVLGSPRLDTERGFVAGDLRLAGSLSALAGVVDRPLEQRRDPLLLDLSAGGGHVAIAGGPQSGKSTTIASIILSLALTHTPTEVQFYCLDFGGGVLGGLRGLPHVGGIAGRQDVNAVRRTVSEVSNIIAQRERDFAQLGIDGMSAYRDGRRAGTVPPSPYGDIFLVIDGWGTIRNDFEDIELLLADIAVRGLGYGVHLMISTARWFDVRTNVRDLCGTKLELKIGDPIDSFLDRRAALLVPDKSPGRGILATRHQFLAAKPQIAGSEGMAAVVEHIAAAWSGEPAPPILLLPGEVPFEQLDGASNREDGLAVGVAERDLSPVRLNFAEDPCLILLGDTASGKSGFLRTVARRVQEVYTPAEARMLVIDHRRSLLGGIEGDHLLGYGSSQQSTQSLVIEVSQALAERLPGPDVTPQQLRERSWWQGPELFVLVDDFDLVATAEGHALMPLLPFIPQAADIGLHVIVARRTGGAARGFFEPIMARLRDIASPGLLLSGSRDEGPLLGGLRPQQFPPGRGRLINRQGVAQLIQLTLPPTT